MEENRLSELERRNIDIESGNYNENIEKDYLDIDAKTVIKAETVNIGNLSSDDSRVNNETNLPQTSIPKNYKTELSERIRAFAGKKRPLLPYLPDREKQDRILDQLIYDFKQDKNKPLVCIVHGDKSQGHDTFLERTREVFLPTRFKPDERCPIYKYSIRCPKYINNQNDFNEQLRNILATEITNYSDSSVEQINEFLSNQYTMIYINFSVEDWFQLKVDCIRFFLEFWQKWTSMCSGQFLMVCLSIKYPTEENLSFCKRFHLKRMKRKFISKLEQFVNSQLSYLDQIVVTVLPELEGIRQEHVEDWLSIEVKKHFQDDSIIEHLDNQINFLYTKWSQQNSSNAIPMNYLAKNLRKLLQGDSLKENDVA